MEEDVHFGHIEGVEVVKRVAIHHVSEALEAVIFIACVHQERACDVRHALHVANVRAKDRKGRKDIFERLVEFLTLAEVAQVDKCTMQVFFHNLDILLERHIVLNVVLRKAYPHKQCLIQLLVHSQFIAYEALPSLAANLYRHAFLESFSEAAAR